MHKLAYFKTEHVFMIALRVNIIPTIYPDTPTLHISITSRSQGVLRVEKSVARHVNATIPIVMIHVLSDLLN
jgi:hypothetical protein